MAGHCKINPAKSLNGAGLWIQNGPLHKIENFRGAQDFLGPLNGTRRLCRDHLESMHKPAPLSDLAGVILQCPATFTVHYH